MSFSDRIKKISIGVWDYVKIAKIELIVLAAVLAFDLIVKAIVGATMYVGQTIVIIPKFFNITYVLNTKAAFGSAFGLENLLGDTGIRIVFLVITVLAVGFFSVFLYKSRGKHITGRIGMALIISGALGNFVDRLFLGHVRDFAQIVFFGLDLPLLGESFAIFNIADVALIAGVVLFLVYFIWFFEKKEKPEIAEDKTQFELVADGESANTDGESVNGDGRTVSVATRAADITGGREDGKTNTNAVPAAAGGVCVEVADTGGSSQKSDGKGDTEKTNEQ